MKHDSSLRPRADRVPRVAAHYGLSRAFLYAEEKAGRIKFLKINGATLIEYTEADRWFEERTGLVAA